MMDRRIFLTTVAGLVTAPLVAEGQPAGKPFRIGYIGSSSGTSQHLVAAFREGLRDRGWVEGQNVIIEYRWAGGMAERYPTLLGELVGLKVDLIVTTTTAGALAAQRATTEIPIVFTMVSDPLASGLVASLAPPGDMPQAGPRFCRRRAAKCWSCSGRPCPACPASPSLQT
jgi:ABC-type uncharacterized transport system substrate-binding protein